MKSLEIKGARTRLGYKQGFVAEKLGISVHSYRKKESGAVRFSDKEKALLTKVLCLTYVQMNDYLYDGELPMPTGDLEQVAF